MSDFDKFFAEKFDGESQFPRREKNWNQLSKRLDAFDAGIDRQQFVSRTHLRYWQAAAAVALMLTAAAFWWAAAVRNDNRALQQELAALTGKVRQSTGKDVAGRPLQAPSGSRQPAEVVEPESTREITKSAARQKNDAVNRTRLPGLAPQNNRAPENSLATTGNELQNGQADAATRPALSDSASLVTAGPQPPASATPQTGTAPTLPDSARSLASVPVAPIPTLTLLPGTPDTVTLRLDAPGLIQRARQPSRFRMGVQATAGTAQPRQSGVSTIYGPGVTAEFNLLRHFWVGASADWLQFDVSTDEYIPKVHPHHNHHGNNPPDPPHGGGGPNPDPSKLVKVESTQRQQHYSLGLRYALPWRFWVRPAVRVAHTWINASPELVSFRFEKPWSPGPGSNDPEFVVQKYDAQKISNIWRFGVGLEKETPRWVFGLWADYSDNFGPGDATIDMLLFRAGVQYRFN